MYLRSSIAERNQRENARQAAAQEGKRALRRPARHIARFTTPASVARRDRAHVRLDDLDGILEYDAVTGVVVVEAVVRNVL